MIDMGLIFCSVVLGAFVFFMIGYSYATRRSLLAIENVEQWIKDTKSNKWVQYSMYNELEEKYDKLVREHEQYRGMIKALMHMNKTSVSYIVNVLNQLNDENEQLKETINEVKTDEMIEEERKEIYGDVE